MPEYWPTADEWEHDDSGWDRDALSSALDRARELQSTDIVVVRGGRLVVDAVWPPSEAAGAMLVERLPGGRVRQDVASTQKSLTSVLAGIAVGRGLLDIEATVDSYLGAGWSGREPAVSEPRITVRHLLTMTSGLADDMSFVAEPGARWDYNLGAAYHTVKRVLAAAAGIPLPELTARWLTEPLQMRDTTWVPRRLWDGMTDQLRASSQYPNGEPIEGLVTTARDLARFGLSVLRGCESQAGGLGVDLAYRRAMVQPSQPFNPAYGYLWWLNGQDRFLSPKVETAVEGPFFPGVPGDAFGAMGAMDRMCVVVPSLDLVITRCGGLAGEPSAASSRFVRWFSAAVCGACPQQSSRSRSGARL